MARATAASGSDGPTYPVSLPTYLAGLSLPLPTPWTVSFARGFGPFSSSRAPCPTCRATPAIDCSCVRGSGGFSKAVRCATVGAMSGVPRQVRAMKSSSCKAVCGNGAADRPPGQADLRTSSPTVLLSLLCASAFCPLLLVGGAAGAAIGLCSLGHEAGGPKVVRCGAGWLTVELPGASSRVCELLESAVITGLLGGRLGANCASHRARPGYVWLESLQINGCGARPGLAGPRAEPGWHASGEGLESA
jgi:hypothetical protein